MVLSLKVMSVLVQWSNFFLENLRRRKKFQSKNDAWMRIQKCKLKKKMITKNVMIIIRPSSNKTGLLKFNRSRIQEDALSTHGGGGQPQFVN